MAIGEKRLRELPVSKATRAMDRFDEISDGVDAVLDLLGIAQHSELQPDDSTVSKAALLLRRLVREMTEAFADVAKVARA